MGPGLGVIRIVVIAGAADEAPSEGGPAPMSVVTTAGLARLGDPVELLRAESPDELRPIAEDPSVDLVLLDRLPEALSNAFLEVIPADGPPSVVIVEGDSERAALSAFRAGASDCIHVGSDFEQVLPVVLLEQVQRWRAERQREVSQQRIRWLEDLYAGVVAEMPAGLVVYDRDGLIVAENPEFTRLFPSRGGGLFAERTVSGEMASPSEFLEARMPPEISGALARMERMAGERDEAQPDQELVRVLGDDRVARAFELRTRQLDAAGRGLLLISDVTESEWRSDRLNEMRRDSRDVIETINSALIVIDPGGHISFANPAAEAIMAPASELVGRPVQDWFGVGTGESQLGPIEACLADGTRSRGTETLLQRGDGHWIPVGVWCSPRHDAQGQRRGCVAVFQDLSEIRELELHVRQTEKMASIGQLAAGVAHEVNNPMGFIHANLHQMAEYLTDLESYFEATEKLLEAAREGDLEVIRAAADDVATVSKEVDLDFIRSDFAKALLESNEGAERIRHIVKDLRDFSRPDLPEQSTADLNQAIESTASIVYSMMKHSVTLEKELQPLPKIRAYPMQLKQVFMNLLVNAHQAIEARTESEPGVIRVETALVEEDVVVRISDSGIGIAEEDQSRIFEPFFTTKPAGTGTGLGLSTCFKIIERHGGRIAVESEVGRGTTFEVRLPVAGRAEGPEEEARVREPSASEGRVPE